MIPSLFAALALLLATPQESKAIAEARRAARSEDPAVRIAAWQALAAQGEALDPPASPKLTKALLDAFEHESHEVRLAVLALLADAPHAGTLATGLANAVRDGTREGEKRFEEFRKLEVPGKLRPSTPLTKKNFEKQLEEVRKLSEEFKALAERAEVELEWTKAHAEWMTALVAAATKFEDQRVSAALIEAARSKLLPTSPPALAAALLVHPTQSSVRAVIELLQRLDETAEKATRGAEQAQAHCTETREHLRSFAAFYGLSLDENPWTAAEWRRWFLPFADRFPTKLEQLQD